MNNVNSVNNVDSHQKKSGSFGKLPYVLALGTILNIANPTEMNANDITYEGLQNVEVLQNSDIISNIQSRTGILLPSMYTQKLRNFVSTNRIMKDRGSAKFTENFIVKELQSNWGISKQNQLLFMWHTIYKGLSNTNLYDGSDGNTTRMNEYISIKNNMEDFGLRYRNSYREYLKQRSADADRRSADADRRSADADKEIISITNDRLNQLIEFYNLYRINPNNIRSEEIIQMKNSAKRIIKNCKTYNINYKAKLSPEVRRFYGID